MTVADKWSGKAGLCPFCKQQIDVPPQCDPVPIDRTIAFQNSKEPVALDETSTNKCRARIPATKAQKDYARDLGIEFPDDIDRFVLSRTIDEVTSELPATEKQKSLLRAMNIHFPAEIKRGDASTLIEHALEFKDRIKDSVRAEYDLQQKNAGMLIEQADVDQLLYQLDCRGKFFFALILDDDEFRYKENAPFKGQFLWNDGLDQDDVKYLLRLLNARWVKGFDSREYLRDQFDGRSPDVDLTVRILK